MRTTLQALFLWEEKVTESPEETPSGPLQEWHQKILGETFASRQALPRGW